jgi:uncharacterized protein YerC
MPYIKANDGRREALQRGETAQSAGELNYQIFYTVKYYADTITPRNRYLLKPAIHLFVYKFLGEKRNYQKYNDMTGALIRCCREVKRRLNLDLKKEFYEVLDSYDDEIAKYEDQAIIRNGDV